MGKQLDKDVLIQVVEAYEQFETAADAARSLGIVKSTFNSRMEQARIRGILPNNEIETKTYRKNIIP